MMKSKSLLASVALALGLAGCMVGEPAGPSQSGGTTGSGGAKSGGSGGGSGGSAGSGGTTSSGGTTNSGGSTNTGGSSVMGGTTSSGGNSAGGVAGTGGKVGTGGNATTGGRTGGGGSTVATGGISGDGGTIAKGGTDGGAGDAGTRSDAAGTGGRIGTGGAGTGGVGPGGTTGSGGGTTSPPAASGYPAAGASGQAKPTGSGTTVTVVPWAGFKGAISFNFDDSNQTQIDHYKEITALNDQGNNARFTFYLQTGKAESKNAVWGQAVKDGHELGNHTQSHSSSASASDLDAAENFIKTTWGVTAYSLAAPNGNSSYETAAKGKFLTNRTAGDNGAIAMTDNPDTRQFTLPCILPASGASTSAMTSPIDTAVKAGKWSTLLIHGFSGGSDGAYNPVAFNNWTAAVKWAKDQGNIWIDTVGTVSAYWVAGYRFSKLTPTTSGTDKTWTWKITDFYNPFPPGKYLRVKTDGGTLKQADTVLTWDDHGYYEVALDKGTLTLSAQ